MSETTPPATKTRGAGPGRTSTSCSECQRRKQKCDKQWPCRHCQDRRVPHLCQFKKKGNNDTEQDFTVNRPLPRATTPPKRKLDEIVSPEDGGEEYAKRIYHLNDQELAELGFTESGRNTTFRKFLDQPGVPFTTKALTGKDERPKKHSCDPFPPRPYADVLIHNFCDNINYVYCILHPESFLEEYNNWWQARRQERNIELESLLLRICAISAQFLPESVCERLESEMCADIQELKQQWHESAEKLCNQIRPGKGGTKHVQQIFLTSSYYKTEAMFVESWHSLSHAVRIAQEIGMHKDSPDSTVTDFDREVRRAVWMSLYTWDRLMAFIFDRPCMISRAHCKLVEPKLSLWNDPIHPELPSPLLSRVCEFRMTKRLDKYLDEDLSQADIGTLVRPLQDIKAWLDELPALYRVKDPDTSHDQKHRRIRHSRLGLHTTSYVVLFHLLQPCLTDEQFPKGATVVERRRLRSACMEYCLRMTDVVDRLSSGASHSRFHMSFCLFETSATACAAMVKDKDKKLPRREDVARAMGRAQEILDRLGPTTAVARSSARILTDLMNRLKIDQPDTVQYIEHGRLNALYPNNEDGCKEEKDSALGSSVGSPATTAETVAKSPNTSPRIDLEQSMPIMENPEEVFNQVDFGVVDAIWDWDNFDFQFDMDTLNAMMDQSQPQELVH